MKRAVRRSKPKRKISWCLVWGVALAVELAAVAYTSPWTGLRRAVVVNAEVRDREWIAAALRAHRGTPILSLDPEAIRCKLAKEPRIERAATTRGIDGRLTLRVRYREPFARLQTEDGMCDLDRDGLPFRRAEGACRYVVQLEGAAYPKLGMRLERLGDPMSVLKELDRRKLAERAILAVDRQGAMCLNIGTSAPVNLGAGDRVPDKLATLQTIVQRDSTLLARAKYVDVKCPEAPAIAWKQRDGAATPVEKKASEDEPTARSEPR